MHQGRGREGTYSCSTNLWASAVFLYENERILLPCTRTQSNNVPALGMFKPHLATLKDADTIDGYFRLLLQKVKTILQNHQQSGHHSSGERWLHAVQNSFLNGICKNIDVSYFYAFLLLEDKVLKFASRKLRIMVVLVLAFGVV